MARLEAVRVAQDAAYAASLSDADWYALSHDPDWQQLVAEQSELLTNVLEVHGHKLPGASLAASTQNELPPVGPFKIVGTDVARLQGLGVVTSLGQYTENMRMPGMLFMRTLRSRYPHAKIKSVDISKAEKLPGVRKILHRGNLPDVYKDVFLGAANPTRFLFSEEVFEVGAPIAVIAADSEHIADEAMRQIDVQYEVLPAALDMLEAMKPSTQKQFPNQLDGTIIAVTPPLVRGNPNDTRADATVEAVFHKPIEQHVALELTNSLTYWDNDKLNMTYTAQHAHGTRANLSQALKIPQNKVRVFQPGYMGSGYGYRSGIDLAEVHAALLAKLTGRPIKLNYTRYEDFVTRTHRNEFRDEMKMGVNKDGTIAFGQFKVFANVGAQRAGAANGSWVNMQDLYKIPNLRLEAIDVMTNSYKSGPYRCVSHPNGAFALEVTMEKAAYAIGMDPVQFRLKNLNETGNPDTKKPFSNPGMRDCIDAAANAIGWTAKWHQPKAKEVRPGIFHGIGLAAHTCSHGAGGNPSTGQIVINNDGSVQAISASNDVGGGQRTTMLMIAAESLGVPLDQITITTYVDTDNTTDTGTTAGSQQTNNGGRGMYQAGQDARRQVLDWAARKFKDDAAKKGGTLDVTAADIELVDGNVFVKSSPSTKAKLADIVQFKGGPIHGKSEFIQDTIWERLAWAAHAAEVEVDTVTGTVKITKYVAVHDLGKAINPFASKQQIEGGVVMAVGAALTEELLIDKSTGLPLNPNLLDYKPLSIKDAPLAEVIIDLTTIKDLATIKLDGGSTTIGAVVTLQEIVDNDELKKRLPLLTQAAESVASPLIRNFGTLGGNVNQRPRCWFFRGEDFNCYKKGGDFCYAVTGDNRYHAIIGGELCYIVHPSDTATALMALNASAKIDGVNGGKTVSFDEYFTGPRVDVLRENILKPGEFMTHITIPNPPGGVKFGWSKLKDRQVYDFALTSVAVAFTMDGNNWKDGRVVLGGVAPVPYRATVIEDALKGKDIKSNIKQAAAQIRTVARPMSLNAYKVDLAAGLIERTVMDALATN